MIWHMIWYMIWYVCSDNGDKNRPRSTFGKIIAPIRVLAGAFLSPFVCLLVVPYPFHIHYHHTVSVFSWAMILCNLIMMIIGGVLLVLCDCSIHTKELDVPIRLAHWSIIIICIAIGLRLLHLPQLSVYLNLFIHALFVSTPYA